MSRTPKALVDRLRRGADSSTAAATAERESPATGSARRLATTLIVNPYSSGMTARREREIVLLLRDHTELEVRRTERPGHAPELAREARESGSELVIACGGDGTGNEVINGLGVQAGSAADIPRLMLIPAGGTNVLCRSLGLTNHPVKATMQLVEAIQQDRTHTVNLGQMDERLFLFSSGVGFDGELVRRAEQRRSGRRPGDLAHVAMVTAMFVHERLRFSERMTITVDSTGEQLRAAFVMCGNHTPVSYVGKLPAHVMPDCSLDEGLDFVAPRRFDPFWLARVATSSIGKRKVRRSSDAAPDNLQLHHDLERFNVVCDEPIACQVDGEFVGERTHIRYELVRDAVRLVY